MSNGQSHSPGVGDLVARRYRIESVIGTGGMAVVYRALDQELGRPVALKVFRSDVVDAASVSRQSEEIRLIASLDHPALVTLYDAVPGVEGDERATGVLVMQLVEGRDLRYRIAETGAMPAHSAAAIGADIAGALAYVHGRGVIHRDVSPGNVLLPESSEGGTPVARLADFGIARLIDSAGLTQTGTVIGTASYMSPEQAEGKSLGPSSDIYSLGLTLLEALTGERAFPGTAIESAMARLSSDPPIPDSLGEHWVRLITAMTSRDPDARPTASEALVTLRALETAPEQLAATELLPAATQPMPQATKLLPAAAASPIAPTEVLHQGPTEVLRRETTVTTTAPPVPRAPLDPARRRALLIVGAVVAVAVIGLVAANLAGLGGPGNEPATELPTQAASSPTAEPEPVVQEPVEPTYPAVDGELGESLIALQELVGFDRLGEETATALQQQVLAITTSSADGDYGTALEQVESLTRTVDDSAIDGSAAEELRESLDRVKDNLKDLERPGKGPKDKDD